MYIELFCHHAGGQGRQDAAESGRACAHPAASLAIDPARLALPFQTTGELPLIPHCLPPLPVQHYSIATALGTIATAVPVNRKYFPLERNLLLVF